jgi:hypothetical protein
VSVVGLAAVTVCKDVTLSALVVVVVAVVIIGSTNGTDDDGVVEGTTAGVGLTASGRVTLVCFVDCTAAATVVLLPPPPPPRDLLRSFAPAASFMVAGVGSGARGVCFMNG